MSFRIVFLAAAGLICWASSLIAARFEGGTRRDLGAGPAQQRIAFESDVLPILSDYCFGCHGNGKKKGDVALDAYKTEASVLQDRKVWEKVLHNLNTHVMPPENKRQPTPDERDRVVRWIETTVFKCDCDHPDPGRVTLRRLNRAEYNNTIRDLVGVDFQPAEDFPADDVGYGFDNIGDVLSMPPILMEKYMAAAEQVLRKAIVTEISTNGPVKRFKAADLKTTAPGEVYGKGGRSLNREGEIYTAFQFPADGEYLLRARAFGQQAGPEPARMEFRLADRKIQVVDVTAVEDSPLVYEVRLNVERGDKKVSAAYINNYVNPKDPDPNNRDRNLIIDYLEVVGPAGPPTLPETHRRIFIRQPAPGTEKEAARAIIANFAKRAYRRPVKSEEVERLVQLTELAKKEGDNFEKGIGLALQAMLVSPHFLFRGELQPEPNNPDSIHPINQYALASRLSYFLWSSLPDDELFAQAERKTLLKNLEAQVKRMLRSEKSRALVDNFASQWLQTRNLDLATPDKATFPAFDDALRAAMRRETEMFFETVLREDRSVQDFIDGNYTFLNERLARHYGINGISGPEFQRVSLKGTPRGGVLTHASVLTITSNPTRTSPVKRGKWVLENLLGTPPPPPPPDVPELKEGKDVMLTGTLRQRMEQHRANPTCAGCHARMDPIGFGFENFDGIGGWREKDGQFDIDPAGQLVSGESFHGPEELRAVLLKSKRNEFVRCLSEKMLTYALGRGLEYYDKCAVDQITKDLRKKSYRFSSLIIEVVKSTPFQMRRGEGDRLAQASK